MALRYDLYAALAALTSEVLAVNTGTADVAAEEKVTAWEQANAAAMDYSTDNRGLCLGALGLDPRCLDPHRQGGRAHGREVGGLERIDQLHLALRGGLLHGEG